MPDALKSVYGQIKGNIDTAIVYNVVRMIYVERGFWDFIGRCLSLLQCAGEILFDDLPNLTMLKHLFSITAEEIIYNNVMGEK